MDLNFVNALILGVLFLVIWFIGNVNLSSLVIKLAFAGLFSASVCDLAWRWETVSSFTERVMILFMLLIELGILYTISSALIEKLTDPLKSKGWWSVVRWVIVAVIAWGGVWLLVTVRAEPRPGARLALLAGSGIFAYMVMLIEELVLEIVFGISSEELSNNS